MSAASPAQARAAPAPLSRVPLRVRWLRINRFLDVEPGTELHFNDKLNVLLGRNGSGKTTLLNLLSMIVRDDFRALRSREVDLEYALDAGELEVVARLRHAPSGLASESGEPLLDGPQRMATKHSLVFRYLGVETAIDVVAPVDPSAELLAGRPPRHLDDPLDVQRAALYVQRVLTPKAMVRQPDGQLVVDLRQHRHELALANRLTGYSSATYRLDESLDVFHQAIVGGSSAEPYLEVSRPRAGPAALANSFAMTARGLKSFEMFQQLHDRVEGVPSTEPLRLDDWLPYLPRFAAQIGATRVEYVLDRPSVQVDGENEILRFLAPTFFVHTRDGGVLRHDELSYGEKRLLAICHYVACNPDVVIMDEMVNGLHADWIEFCLSEIGDRQAFLASQNPVLVDNLALRSAEDAKLSFVLCERAGRADGRPAARRWRHMSDDEAASFMEAYDVGLQRVSEILRVKGLW